MPPKQPALSSLSNEALCKLRDEIAALLEERAKQLRTELDRLTSGNGAIRHADNGYRAGNGAASKANRKKVAPKYRGPDGSTWAGRGVKPRWLVKAMQSGQKAEDFLIVPKAEH
jgi:DNA-binding protein H-NS